MRPTGARPGEALIIRACDINMSGQIWEYRPARFKTEHHRHRGSRVVMIGPSAQAVLRPFLKVDTTAYLFSPRDAIEDIIEPYMIQQGFIQRTPRGRVLTANAWKHLGLTPPKDLEATQFRLFSEDDRA